MLLVLLTDGRPINEFQNPCAGTTRSALLHAQGVRTAIVGMEGAGVSDLAPFEWPFYLYAHEVSFVGVESVRLVGRPDASRAQGRRLSAALRRQH